MKSWTCLLFGLVTWGLAAETPSPLALHMNTGFDLKVAEGLSTKETIGFEGLGPLFESSIQLQINSDGKYGADIANFSNSKSFFDNYFFLDQGYLTLHTSGLLVQLGRSEQPDAYSSPYSLFLNGLHHSALGGRFRYEDEFFSYETRWISLNQGSQFAAVDVPEAWKKAGRSGFPDRGANLKTFIFKLGDWRLGIQDAAVYTGRSFDFEHFISPLPSYFTQYVKNTAGRPWTAEGNENNLIGFFLQWTGPDSQWGGQVLVDDFSLHFLLPNDVPNNPWKAAWTLGGDFQTEWGRFGVFHAGALRYTFEPITTGVGQEEESAYGYTYYPDVEYSVGGGRFRTLAVEDNALGYRHGENNFALMVTFDRSFAQGFRWATNLEFTLAGSNSPANPWQDATSSEASGGTRWLDDPVLEKAIVWTSDLRWTWGDWQVYVDWKLGWVANILQLRAPGGTYVDGSNSTLDHYVKIFAPSGNSAPVGQASLGFTWHYDVSALQRKLAGAP